MFIKFFTFGDDEIDDFGRSMKSFMLLISDVRTIFKWIINAIFR